MRKLILGFIFIAVGAFFAAAGGAAKAAGNWTDFSLPGQTPWCGGGGGCPSLHDSCMSAAYSWWASDPAAHLRACYVIDENSGHADVDAYCCAALYQATPQLTCPFGQIPDPSVPTGCRPPDDPPCCTGAGGGGAPTDSPMEGNPLVVSGGAKFDQFVDFATAGPNALSFVRTYNSHSRATLGLRNLPLGHKWLSNFDFFLWSGSPSNYNTMYALRPDGSTLTFTLSGSVYTTASDRPLKLVKNTSTFTLTDIDDTVETYDLTGKLQSIVRRNGYTQTLAYDSNGKLQSVTDSYGRALTFTFSGDRLSTMTVPDGTLYRYVYDKSFSSIYQPQPDRLIGVVYPKTGAVDSGANPQATYHYENTTYPLWLTGITDEKGVRYVTWSYDADGRAVSSEHAGGVDETTLTFNVNGTVTATRPLGKQIIYSFTTIAGRPHVSSIAQQASANTPSATESRTYDSNGFIASRTDNKGNVTNYVYDARGLQTSRTEAHGTAQARTIATTWHSTLHVPTQIVEPGKTTDFTYDSAGRVLTKTETDTRTQTVPYSTNGQTRTWTYTWDSTGLLQTVNGPRTDVTDTTTYSWTNGVLTSVTNALSQATTINAVNERGLPTQITDSNGVVTDLAYNQRGWLTSVTKRSSGGDATTAFEYDAVGQITAIVQPDGVRLDYEYDNARRLTAVENSLGERIEYTLDDMGNRTAENIKDSGGGIVKSMTRSHDELGRLLSSIGAASQTTAYAYDKNDNVTSITDPLSGVTAQAYDALDRLISSTDPATEVTAYGYDDQDNLTSVTDARSVQTAYVVDGFGRVIQTASPDGGTTVYVYDKADNLTEKTDGRGVVTQYSYDALNRITAKTFPAASSENVAYTYDDTTSGHFGIGRLDTITDESGSTAFIYDSRGNVVQETRTIAGTAYVTQYVYDPADRLTQMVYPSGRIISYARDTLGRVTAVTTQASSSAPPATIAADIAYKPFGPIASMDYGNGLARSYSYDSDYRLTDLVTGDADTFVQDLTYGYDDADNILSIADAITSGRSQTFTYDDLFRLKTAAASGTYGSITYNYDEVGNRTSVVDGAGTESYSTDSASNRLLSATLGSTTRTFTYDGAGNITADARGSTTYGLTYNEANRLSQVSVNSTPDTDYLYNALGERVKKAPAATPSAGTRFHYDRDGKLIAESDGSGAVIREYAWLDGLPIGEFTNAGAGTPPGQTQLDNTDSGASFTGSWSTATAGSGYIGSNYHKFEPLSGGVPPGGTTIDNTSANFTTFGLWASATTPAGFEGGDYVARASGDSNGSETIQDNTDAGFSVTGTWTSGTGGSGGYYGTDYVIHDANQPPPEAVIVDNTDAGASLTGTWSASLNSPKWGSNFRFKAAGTGTATFTWTPTLPSTQQYNVYAYWRATANRATNARPTRSTIPAAPPR
jgi:YD repeat-containing protein